MTNQPNNKTAVQKFNEAITVVLSPLRGVLALAAIFLALGVVIDMILLRYALPHLVGAMTRPEVFASAMVGVAAILFATK